MLHKSKTGGGHRAVGSYVDALCLRTEFRVLQAAATARTLRLRYLDQPRRHATAVRTPGQMLRICCRGRARARASVRERHGYTVSVHCSCRRHTLVRDARRSIEFDKTTPSARPNGARRTPSRRLRLSQPTHLSACSPQTQPGARPAWAWFCPAILLLPLVTKLR